MNPLKSPRSFNLSRSVVVLVAALTALATPIVANARTMDHAAQAGGKKIVISLAAGRVCAYQGGTAVFCTGANMRGTRRGTFYIQNKLPVAKSFKLGWRLPYWMGIYYGRGLQNGFHGIAYTSRGGRTGTSLGCIVMPDAAAIRLYRWASIGTPVIIR